MSYARVQPGQLNVDLFLTELGCEFGGVQTTTLLFTLAEEIDPAGRQGEKDENEDENRPPRQLGFRLANFRCRQTLGDGDELGEAHAKERDGRASVWRRDTSTSLERRLGARTRHALRRSSPRASRA